jgi:hypothetical protein
MDRLVSGASIVTSSHRESWLTKTIQRGEVVDHQHCPIGPGRSECGQ